MYFLKGGKCGFVLPKHRNIKYIDIHVGGYFGLIDIVGSIFSRDIQFNDWIQYKDILRRQFSVMSQTNCDLLLLSIHDLNKMRWEFLEAYEALFQNAYNRLNRALKVKLHAIKFCKKNPPETLNKKQLLQLQGKIGEAVSPKKKNEVDGVDEEEDEEEAEIERKKATFVSVEKFKPINLEDVDEENSSFFLDSQIENSDSRDSSQDSLRSDSQLSVLDNKSKTA